MIDKFNELNVESMFISKEEQRLKEIRSRLINNGSLTEHTIKKKNNKKKRKCNKR